MKQESYFTGDRIARWTISAIVLVAIFFLAKSLSAVLTPFAIGLVLAYYTLPIVDFFERKLKRRGLAILTTLLLTVLILGTLLLLAIPYLAYEIGWAAEVISNYLKENPIPELPGQVKQQVTLLTDWDQIKSFTEKQEFEKAIEWILPKINDLFSSSLSLLNVLFQVGMALVYWVFILIDYKRVVRGIKALVPMKWQQATFELTAELTDNMNRYFRAQAIISLCTAVMYMAGFSIIGLPMGLFLGLTLGLMSMVPYLPLVGVIPAIALAFIQAADTGSSFGWAVGKLLIVVGIVQLIQDWVISPKIMGKASGLPPAIILLSLAVWGSLLGLLGMVIAIPLTTVAAFYIKKYNSNPISTTV